MPTSRPSLNSLRAFETTARLRSVTRAADELFVTPGAVSRLIKLLEETVSVPLLVRGPHSTHPTPEGMRLAEELTLLLLLQRLVELFVRDQALAQQQGAEVRAGLVLEEGVVQACRPHVSAGIGILAAGLER